jgi:outer membrane protein assembly factor BamD (BamD/ComL family)
MSNKKDYAKYKRPIGKLYNTSTALQAEGHIDTAIRLFCSELETRFIDGGNANKAFSLDEWLLYCKVLLPCQNDKRNHSHSF